MADNSLITKAHLRQTAEATREAIEVAMQTQIPSEYITETELDTAIAAIPVPDMSSKQDKITGTAGDFVVIGADGNVTTKTIARAEEETY